MTFLYSSPNITLAHSPFVSYGHQTVNTDAVLKATHEILTLRRSMHPGNFYLDRYSITSMNNERCIRLSDHSPQRGVAFGAAGWL